MPICEVIPLRYLIYSALLSHVVAHEEEGVKHGVFGGDLSTLCDSFSDWTHGDSTKCSYSKALKELGEEGLVMFDAEDDELVYLGEFRGKRFFAFEVQNSIADKALEMLEKAIRNFKKSRSAVAKSRGRYIEEQTHNLLASGVQNLSPSDFTTLHGYLYELYTGGEIYQLRNKVEYFQTTNMLKAYDKATTFAIMVRATLDYDTFRKNGVPTLTNVACMKDDVFRIMSKPDTASKDYMREGDSEDMGEF